MQRVFQALRAGYALQASPHAPDVAEVIANLAAADRTSPQDVAAAVPAHRAGG